MCWRTVVSFAPSTTVAWFVNVFSQKDMAVTTLNNHATVVNGAKDTTVRQHIRVQSLDSEIYVEAKTRLTLKCGASTLQMNADGTIVIDGRHVVVKGSDAVDLNP